MKTQPSEGEQGGARVDGGGGDDGDEGTGVEREREVLSRWTCDKTGGAGGGASRRGEGGGEEGMGWETDGSSVWPRTGTWERRRRQLQR